MKKGLSYLDDLIKKQESMPELKRFIPLHKIPVKLYRGINIITNENFKKYWEE